jgi:hypothetical protein
MFEKFVGHFEDFLIDFYVLRKYYCKDDLLSALIFKTSPRFEFGVEVG